MGSQLSQRDVVVRRNTAVDRRRAEDIVTGTRNKDDKVEDNNRGYMVKH